MLNFVLEVRSWRWEASLYREILKYRLSNTYAKASAYQLGSPFGLTGLLFALDGGFPLPTSRFPPLFHHSNV